MPAESLIFVNEQAVRWPDTSLGCPEPGKMYAKVIVPGHRITFAYNGDDYEVHTASGPGIGKHLQPASREGGLAYPR